VDDKEEVKCYTCEHVRRTDGVNVCSLSVDRSLNKASDCYEFGYIHWSAGYKELATIKEKF